jgi:hydrocephalus-inducing protein
VQVTVEFSPYVAKLFKEICYVELEGHAERQPVVLTGLGLGPCAIFTYDVLDIGNAYINTLYRYSVQLENRGDIPAPFAVQPGDGEFGSMFTFVPSDGVVPAETTLDIEVELLATHIGRLEEWVLVDVAGMDSPLSLQFKGRIVGPTFDIDVEVLNFGMVAYGFRCVAMYFKILLLNLTGASTTART